MTELTVVPLELRKSAEPHTLDGVCVPYGVVTLKAGYPQGERFLPGAFAEVANRTGQTKIRLTDSHDDTGRRPIGVGVEFRDTPDALLGKFRFYNTPEGRGGWENAQEETYGGLSVGFVPIEERVADDGVREIVRARLFHVSLVDEPAYDDAKVLAVRSAYPDVSELLAIEYRPEDMPEEVDLSRLVWGRS